MTATRLRVAVIGLTGSGKSTCASIIEELAAAEGLSHARVKLAKPLYDLQEVIYRAARATLADGAQDQLLMESLADHLRRINPRSIAEDFAERLGQACADVVINDDLRDPHVDAPILRDLGFRVLRVRCDEDLRRQRLAGRADPTLSDRSTRELDLIPPDAVLDNSGGLDRCRAAVGDLLRSWW